MPDMRLSTNKLNVYMIKPQFQRLEEIVEADTAPIAIENVGYFFYAESHPNPPEWIRKFFGTTIDQELRILSSSTKGLLIVPISDGQTTVYFAVAFGVGRHLLKDGVLEERFGLKVVLNSADPESLRSIDKTTLGSVPKHSREQMSRDVNASEFGIDIEQDLISSVTAKSKDTQLGKTPTGRDALSVSVKIDITNIVDFLKHCLTRYKSNDYKASFEWIDQIAEVRDRRKIEGLEILLAEKLSRRELEKIWMAVPEVVDWEDIAGFRYLREKTGDLHEDVGMKSFLDSLDDRSITAETLRNERVYMVSASTDIATPWTAFRCTYAELEFEGDLYILNNGKWYVIDRGFTERILRDYTSFARSAISLPDCVQKDEGTYNTETAAALGFCCMDKKLIQHGGGHSSIEFCDLFTPDKKIIHVKRYGGSSPLSHLFAQGVVSGELFVSDAEFRQKLNSKLPDDYKLTDHLTRPKSDEYEIVYAIISYSDSDLDIPFFSKVNLRNARNRLALCGYKVSLKKVQKVETSPLPESVPQLEAVS